jgi:hypothetical protein
VTELAPVLHVLPKPARSFPVRGLLFVGLAALVVAVDQTSKRLAENKLERTGVRSVPVPGVGDYLRLT